MSAEWTSSLTVENDESVVAWFYRVLRNAVTDHYRRKGSAQRTLEAFATELETVAGSEPEMKAAVCKCVSRLSATLKPEYADALRRVEVDGVAVKDYASETGILERQRGGARVPRARGTPQTSDALVRDLRGARVLRLHLRRVSPHRG